MKQLIKNVLGRLAVTTATAIPAARRVLCPLGLRTSQDLFTNRVVSIQFARGRSFKLTSVDRSYLAFQLFWHGGDYYEPISRALVEQLVQPGSTFLDIGAHLGFFSLVAGVFCREVQIVAFEPNPANLGLLQANMAANGLSNVLCEAAAISDRDGSATLYLTESDMSASLMKDFQAEDTVQIDRIQVHTVSIDSYVEKHGIASPLVIKVDIEGHEPAFFRGAAKTIAQHKPDILLEVLYEQDRAVVDWLKGLGYHFYPVTDQGLIEVETPKLVKRYPFLFLNHLLSTRPRQSIEELFKEVQAETLGINLRRTSKHFPRAQWPLLWEAET